MVWYQLKELGLGIWTGQTDCAVSEHMGLLLQSQPSILSYSIPDNKYMVLMLLEKCVLLLQTSVPHRVSPLKGARQLWTH